MDYPAISVFMPAYNAERFLSDAVNSILKQTFKNFELVIINDGSTDKTPEILQSFKDSRIRIINNPANTGLVSVRNQGVQECKAPYIAFLDSDDIALPSRLENQKNFLDSHKEIGLVGSAVKLIGEKSAPTGVLWKSNLPSEEIRVALLFHNQFAQSSIMLRKEILPENPYREGFAPAEDYDLWARLSKKTLLWNMPKVLTLYRVNPNGSSSTQKEKQIQAVNEIRSSLLSELGISATPDELSFHKRRIVAKGESLKDFFKRKSNWLRKLVEANQKTKIYPENIFQKGIAREWLETCYANTKLGLSTLSEFQSSEFHKIGFKGKTIKIVKLLVKCLLKIA